MGKQEQEYFVGVSLTFGVDSTNNRFFFPAEDAICLTNRELGECIVCLFG